MATTEIDKESLAGYRITMIKELGFSKEEAEKLADSFYSKTLKQSKGVSVTYQMKVDHHYIRRMMDNGATKEQVLAILL